MGYFLALYSQSTAAIEPNDVDAVLLASFDELDGFTSDTMLDALRVSASVSGYDAAQDHHLELYVEAQLAGDRATDPKGPSATASFVLGGRLAEATLDCGGIDADLKTFDQLDAQIQVAVETALEDQLLKLQTLKNIAPSEITSTRIRERAHGMQYVVVSPNSLGVDEWEQAIPDALRTRPAESDGAQPPSEQTFSGWQWAATCELDTGLGEATVWGNRLDLPSAGIAVPADWKESGRVDADQQSSGIPVESETDITWRNSSTGLDAIMTAEASPDSWRSETEHHVSLNASAVLGPTSESLLAPFGESSLQSTVGDDSRYLGSSRFSLRFTSDFYRATSQLALFLSGALFGLAATILIAITKTLVRGILRDPKA